MSTRDASSGNVSSENVSPESPESPKSPENPKRPESPGGKVSSRNASFLSKKRRYNKNTMMKVPLDISPEEGEFNDIEENQTENLQAPLPEDIYSIILFAKGWSSTLCFAIFGIFFQFLLLGLILVSTIETNFSVIFKVGELPQVFVAQGLAMWLSVFMAEDFLNAIAFIFVPVDKKMIESIPEVSKTRWIVAFGSKLAEGLLFQIVMIVLILTREAVIGLCLNFAALSFVWTIDNTLFSLGLRDFFTREITECTNRVTNTEISLVKAKKIRFFRNTVFYLIMLGSTVLWSFGAIQQIMGVYFCHNILIQFDDLNDPKISKLSGVYTKVSSNTLLYPIYENMNACNSTHCPAIAYCSKHRTWTLSMKETNKGYSECDWLAKSSRTRSLNIMDLSSGWIVNVKKSFQHSSFGPLPFENMKIECIDCHGYLESIRDSCNYNTCSKRRCVCDDKNYYGLSCEFPRPCERLVPYNRKQDIKQLEEGGLEYVYSYNLLKKEPETEIIEEEQNRPVWYRRQNATTSYIFFNGFRWIETITTESTSWRHKAKTVLYSEPMIISSPKDKSTPTFLQWYEKVLDMDMTDETVPVQGSLVCEGCSEEQKCRHGAECQNNRCQCKNCTTGVLCEIITCPGKKAVDFL